jgi:hypothetical protein
MKTVRITSLALVVLTANMLSAQMRSQAGSINLTATVPAILKMAPAQRVIVSGPVSALMHNAADDELVVYLRVSASAGETRIQLPVLVSSNLRSFILQAKTTSAVGTISVAADAASDKQEYVSRPKSLGANTVFAIASRTNTRPAVDVPTTIELQVGAVPAGEERNYRVSIRMARHGA